MHPLHDYIAKQVVEKLKSRRVVVWYDPRREFAPFISEARGAERVGGATVAVSLGGISGWLAEYDGSFFELRTMVEPHVRADTPDTVLIYVPSVDRDGQGSVLMELEKAGWRYEPKLKQLARNVLRQRYTDGVIDDMLAAERVTYEDLARAASDTSTAEPPSLLKVIFHDTPGHDAMLAAWLASDARDATIEEKGAGRELAKLVRSRLGLELPDNAPSAKLRSIALRYVLAAEFRANLQGPTPAILDSIPSPNTKEERATVCELAKRLRSAYATDYPGMSDRVQSELGLSEANVPAESLGSIDTFRFEERAVLAYCGTLIAAQHFDEALALIGQQEQGFWLGQDVARKAQWEAARRMAELGSAAVSVKMALTELGNGPNAWIDAYTGKDGWFRMDQAHRRLEAWVANLEDEPEERPLAVVRHGYEDVCHAMAHGFTKSLGKAGWTVKATLHQTHVYSEVVAEQPKPVAYFLVDAMRFEMGVELAGRLPQSAEIAIKHAIGALPSITPIGMAALQPGASRSFSVVEQGRRLGARIEDAFLPDLAARRKFATARVPNLIDMALDELLSLQPSKLTKKVEEAHVVMVRSQEIDHAGETGFTFQARQVMDTVIDNLARAIRKLALAGVEHTVVTADHGHLFFAADRDQSMRIDSPGGDVIELHRRCWIGRGGSTPPGCVRVAATALGYASDLDFVFPIGCGVFRAGGDLAFHHGGPSLQEMVVPVLTIRLKGREQARARAAGPVTASGLPEAITNRIFSVTIQGDLVSGDLIVRPLLMSAGRQVGAVGMAIGAELDRATGCVKLEPGKFITIAFLLSDENVPSLRVVVQDPATDADLYRSPHDIPVRLGV
jgi:hypothetical protein